MHAAGKKPPGFWQSLLTAEAVAKGKNALSFPLSVAGFLFWQESLADQGNRTVLKRQALLGDGSVEILCPEGISLGSRVHEYGGIAYGIAELSGQLHVLMVNKADQALYLYREGESVDKLFQDDAYRFAEPTPCARGVICIAERKDPTQKLPENLLVLISYAGELSVLHSGEDFYGGLALSPDQAKLAFISWSLAAMPWDNSTLWQGDWSEDQVFHAERLIDTPDVAIFQPDYDPEGKLYYVADYAGLSQIHAFEGCRAIAEIDAECSLPFWQIGMRTFAALGNETFACAASFSGVWQLGLIQEDQWSLLDQGAGSYAQVIKAGEGFAALVAPVDRDEYLVWYPDADLEPKIITRASTRPAAPWVVKPSSVYFAGNWGQVQGYFYRPETETLPPVIIKSHGGPSGQTDPAFQRKFQFWLSRGFAIFDINYSGSTGFGRAYRQRLEGQWGIADTQDCLDGLCYLVDQGWVDPQGAFISGSSAGGLTTLNCLCASDMFAGGVSYYGVCDLLSLVAITHKFEARYLDHLIGTLPKHKETYIARSPITHAHKIKAPMLFLHGDQDPVVPPSQMHDMVEAIKSCGVLAPEVAVEILEGEGHGFRDPENIVRALEYELAFYQRILTTTRPRT